MILVSVLCVLALIIVIALTAAGGVGANGGQRRHCAVADSFEEPVCGAVAESPNEGAVMGMVIGGTFDPVLGDELEELKDSVLPPYFGNN